MNEKQTNPAPAGMNLGDILYIVFRHKWKVLLISATAVVGAFLLPVMIPPSYQSEARLYIRYVLETTAPSQGGENDPRISKPETRLDSLINTELQILTSYDVAQQVAETLGPEKILGNRKGTATREAAAQAVQNGLRAEPAKNSSVISLRFRHPDSRLVQPVLQNLIDSYFKKHTQMHAVGAFDEFLTQETDQLRSRVTQAEEELKKAKEKAGVLSLPDSKRTYTEQIAKTRQEWFDAEAELAQRQASVKAMENTAAGKPIDSTNAVASTNLTPVPPQIAAEHKQVSGLVDTLDKKEQDLLLTFTAESAPVRVVREQLAKNRNRKKQLEDEYPSLLEVKLSRTNGETGGETVERGDLIHSEQVKISALQSKIQVLSNQLYSVQKEAGATQEAEMKINELQRKLDLEEGDYKRFSSSLRQSRIDEKVGAGKVSNISVIQAPSPAWQDRQKLSKAMAFVFLGGLVLAFGIPFVIELYLDRTLKRPIEVERKLSLPLFLSIPRLELSSKPRRLLGGKRLLQLPRHKASAGEGNAAAATPLADHAARGNGHALAQQASYAVELAPWDSRHGLRPFSETLRDRLITFFEMKNMTHKPKLVGVTSCAEGSGVSTVAAGLAASLSETGEGNVLLVDMNGQNGAAHQFYKGDLACGLDEALETHKRDSAMVQDNLYVVSEARGNGELSSVLPRRFKTLVPRLKASDFDYIILDLPPVSQISMTPRLARYMDMVLMVVESEKTDGEVVKRATALLGESQPHLGVVLNKAKRYVPARLQQEL